MKEKDQRVKMMNEILQGIKVNLNQGKLKPWGTVKPRRTIYKRG